MTCPHRFCTNHFNLCWKKERAEVSLGASVIHPSTWEADTGTAHPAALPQSISLYLSCKMEDPASLVAQW